MDATEKVIRTLVLMIFIVLSACTLEMIPQPDPTPQPSPLPPYGQPAVGDACLGKPTPVARLAPPLLTGIEPARASVGEKVKITGSGGYLFWDDECQKGYNESARDFILYLDNQPSGKINCYANHCETIWTIPEGSAPGIHILSVEGGSQLRFEISSR